MNVSDIKPKLQNSSDTNMRQSMMGIHKLIPNLMTMTAIAMGLTAIQLSWDGQWERAVLAILVAVILDAMDGATARLLNATSEFGAQLDSLSDFLAFGVAPSIILYSWILEESGKVGWMAMIVYACACALRLARFNVTQKELPAWKKGFFSGIPSPAGAGLALFPLIIWIQEPRFFEQFSFASPLVGLWMIFVGALMVSRIPTFSTKAIKLPAKFGLPALAAAAFLIACLVHLPWITMTIGALFYMASIPFAIKRFRELQKEYSDDEGIADLALGAIVIEEFSTIKDKQDAP